MVVVVADATFEPRRGSRRLNPPDEPFRDEDAERVVHGLEGDRADLAPDDLGHGVGRDMRLTRDRPHHREPLRRDLNPALTQKIGWIGDHGIVRAYQSFD